MVHGRHLGSDDRRRLNMKLLVIAFALTVGLPLLAAESEQREKMFGTWQAADAGHGADLTWTVERRGKTVRVVFAEGEHQRFSVDCAPTGRNCDATHNGKHSLVSTWFNGPVLVQLEIIGSEIVKRRFVPGAHGDTLRVETIPVSPDGKVQKAEFKRLASISDAK